MCAIDGAAGWDWTEKGGFAAFFITLIHPLSRVKDPLGPAKSRGLERIQRAYRTR